MVDMRDEADMLINELIAGEEERDSTLMLSLFALLSAGYAYFSSNIFRVSTYAPASNWYKYTPLEYRLASHS